MYATYFRVVTLGGLLVIVLAIGPKVHTFKPSRGRWILRWIKIRNTSFRGEVMPVVPCRNILQRVKDPYSMKEILVDKVTDTFPPSSSCAATIVCSAFG
jgi:hypothetical protein